MKSTWKAHDYNKSLTADEQVKDVFEHEREQAFANIKAAAKHYKVDMPETEWHELGKKPHTANPAHKKTA
jgi:hypothetical protein